MPWSSSAVALDPHLLALEHDVTSDKKHDRSGDQGHRLRPGDDQEHATVQDEGWQTAGTWQQRSVARSARYAEQDSAWLVELLLSWVAALGNVSSTWPIERVLIADGESAVKKGAAFIRRAFTWLLGR